MKRVTNIALLVMEKIMITNILLGLILLALVFIGFMVFVLGKMIDEQKNSIEPAISSDSVPHAQDSEN